jgi:hypothetical protein
MSGKVQSIIMAGALAGLMAGAAGCGGSEPAEAPKAEAPKAEAPKAEAPAPAAADEGEQAAASMAAHACKGHNECKGQGGCGVANQNDCKGKNPCKGKGGCKVEVAAADGAEGEQGAKPAAHSCKGQNECKGKGGCAVEGKNDCKGHNECKGKGGCKA